MLGLLEVSDTSSTGVRRRGECGHFLRHCTAQLHVTTVLRAVPVGPWAPEANGGSPEAVLLLVTQRGLTGLQGVCKELWQPNHAGLGGCGCARSCEQPWQTGQRSEKLEPGNKGSSNPVTSPRAFPEQISIEPLITKINVLLFCSLLYKIVILSSFIASNLYTIPF